MEKLVLLCGVLAACEFPRPTDVPGDEDLSTRVAGSVDGMWEGVDGVVLKLSGVGVDILKTVAQNGSFSFSEPVANGTSYVVGIVASPTGHTCQITSGANGVVAAGGGSVVVACLGPPVSIVLPSLDEWKFDPSATLQPAFDVSMLQQQVAAAVLDEQDVVESVTVDGTPVAVGIASAPQQLPIGETTIAVRIVARGGLAKTYQISINRGTRLVRQEAYVKASNTTGGYRFGTHVAISGDTLVVGAPNESSNAQTVDGDQLNQSANQAGAAYVFRRRNGTWQQEAYLKAHNSEALDRFGEAVAISGDTIAVGATGEDGASTGVNGRVDNGASNAGAVYVFHRSGETWTQQAYVKASNTDAGDVFGVSLAIFNDLLAVGALAESSGIVNGDQTDNSAFLAGAVYVFHRTGVTWRQEAYLKASNPQSRDSFGNALALAADTLAVGARGESSDATGINGDQSNDAAPSSGAMYVYRRSGVAWTQEAYIKASNTGADDRFGSSIAISDTTIAVAATGEGSSAQGVGGDESNDGAMRSGAVYVFVHEDGNWKQQAYVKASNSRAELLFGIVALSGDVLTVGAMDSSAATGVDGDQTDRSAPSAGAAHVYKRSGSQWEHTTYIKAANAERGDLFGTSIAVSETALVVSAPAEASSAIGVGGNQGDNSLMSAGAVYVFD